MKKVLLIARTYEKYSASIYVVDTDYLNFSGDKKYLSWFGYWEKVGEGIYLEMDTNEDPNLLSQERE